MSGARWPSIVLIAAVAVAGLASQNTPPASSTSEAAYRANNIGVARLEQFDFAAAAESFRQALRADPARSIARFNLALALFYAGNTDEAGQEARAASDSLPNAPQPSYLLGLIARSQNRQDDAVSAFRRVLTLDPGDVGAQVNLGQVYVQQGNIADAIPLFRQALASEPFNVTAAYNLAIALVRSGAADAGAEAMRRFQALRDSAYGTTFSQNYLEQGRYAEAIASTGLEPDLVDVRPPDVSFVDATGTMLRGDRGAPRAAAPSLRPDRVLTPEDATAQGRRALAATVAGGLTLFDLDGDGDLDLLEAGPAGLHLYRNDAGVFTDVTARAGLASVTGAPIAAVAGDYDNDGRPDLLVLRDGGSALLHQRPDGTFEDVTVAAGVPSYPDLARSAAFVDVDHDGDLDIMIAGFAALGGELKSGAAFPEGAPAGRNHLLRNDGNGRFTDVSADARVAGGTAHAIAIVPTDFDNRRDIDLLIAHDGAPPALYRNMRDGTFQDAAAAAGLPGAARYSSVAAADINKDGYTDFFFGRLGAPGVFALSDGHGRFTVVPAPDGTRGATVAQFLDYDNDGLLDLLTVSDGRARLFRNIGSGWSDVTERSGLAALAAAGAVQAVALGDLDGDGDTDVAVRLATGEVRWWRNDGGNRNRSLHVRLAGRVSNRAGIGSKIELRAGSLRGRLETSAATPAVAPADLLFGLGQRPAADVVRVLWPSGVLQAETAPGDAAATRAPTITVTELNRKPSSCPFLFTWNGSRFEFVTDFMGGGEMGDWVAPGVWNHPDPDEYVRIRGDQLKERDGRYDLRVTNELEETMYVDRLQLLAIDHRQGVDVFPNEGLKEPPRPPFRLITTRGAHPPVSAADEHGHDVLPLIRRMDRRYPDDFALAPIRGYAARHELTLDLGPGADQGVLLLTGWTDYAFSSDNVAAAQAGLTMVAPELQVRDASGGWRTVDGNIGFPVGRPQTVAVDLRGRFLTASREVRIVTSMRIYWDQILVDTSGGGFETKVTRLDPLSADLRWRGFSAETTSDGREPAGYDYTQVSTWSTWKAIVGRYTRQGDVRPLLRASDDMFVISPPGDEIALSFDARGLGVPPPGWTRTFLLYVDGFSKEMNLRSASPDAVEPLPFHAMTKYPYGPPEAYPLTPAHRDYLASYNTRIVHRAIPPIEISLPLPVHGSK